MKQLLLLGLLLFSVTIQAQNSMDWISVSGNMFVNSKGETMVFNGVNIADPDSILVKGHWEKRLFEEAAAWGADLIRIPVHPSSWRSQGTENYLALLDQAISWSKELGMYVIIDWHSIGNLRTEVFFKEAYNTSLTETRNFWRIISQRYANEPTVAFYEIFNEPTTYSGQFGTLTWEQWKEINEDIIRLIKANNPKAIPLVAGFNWGYDLSIMRYNPIDIEGIGYVSHPYPQKKDQPWEPKWEENWGYMADRAPMILTEIGFAMTKEEGVHMPVKGDDEYGMAITEYAKKKGISWTAWVFDGDWEPMMFWDWENFTPTRQGKFFKKVMQE